MDRHEEVLRENRLRQRYRVAQRNNRIIELARTMSDAEVGAAVGLGAEQVAKIRRSWGVGEVAADRRTKEARRAKRTKEFLARVPWI